MFNPCRSSAQSSSTPQPSHSPKMPQILHQRIQSPILGACLIFHTAQSSGSCKYSCTFYDKVFSTSQAFGSYQKAHRKERNALFVSEQQRAVEENDKDNDVVLSPDHIT
ncbi:uncharacterized protein Pyn_17753 [Prunus yedoensis var. nudiflora]|uniref:Uncharacterized protein n=1 Tax=Prunus yedoensis var. nudiflora TaxID=2094558 RepID=A0A315AFG1_PRUYE|nr:uncharacterized protein Pyn_17753 [Prunus yedoensis var. nudiflora]